MFSSVYTTSVMKMIESLQRPDFACINKHQGSFCFLLSNRSMISLEYEFTRTGLENETATSFPETYVIISCSQDLMYRQKSHLVRKTFSIPVPGDSSSGMVRTVCTGGVVTHTSSFLNLAGQKNARLYSRVATCSGGKVASCRRDLQCKYQSIRAFRGHRLFVALLAERTGGGYLNVLVPYLWRKKGLLLRMLHFVLSLKILFIIKIPLRRKKPLFLNF